MLDSDLVLMFGPNGFGKTSLAEAVEWLLTGTTRRRLRGEDYSKSEYEGSFRNVHGGQPTEVSASVRLSSGGRHVISRRIPQYGADTVSEFFIDGAKGSPSDLGIVSLDAVHPVVAQHDLQSFIHSKPKERRDVISRALGLEEVTAFKAALDGARRSFSLTPPVFVETAKSELRKLALSLAMLPETAALAQRWRRPAVEVRREEDISALLKAAKRLAGTTRNDVQGVLSDLRSRRQQLTSTVFDSAALAPPDASTVESLASAAGLVMAASVTVGQRLAEAMSARAAAYSSAALQFWEAGLRLSPDGETCPMCEQQTLTVAQRQTISGRLSASTETLKRDRAVSDGINELQRALARAEQASRNSSVRELLGDDRQRLEKLFAGSAGALDEVLKLHDAMSSALTAVQQAEKRVSEMVASTRDRLADAAKAVELIAEISDIPAAYLQRVEEFKAKQAAYSESWSTFETILTARISSTKVVSDVDAVGKALKAQPHFRAIEVFEQLQRESLEAMRNTEAFLQQKHRELLVASSEQVKSIYDQMNPGASVAFDGMEAGTDQLKLHAKSFGVRMSAAANLSECQLNCLGLAFWLARATSANTPFQFILLDDPVQAMDDVHCEAFIATVLPWLLDAKARQVIVLSHEQRLISRLRDLNKSRDSVVYHFDDYQAGGPTITEQVDLAKMLQEVRGLAKGNEANRKRAVDQLRHIGEAFIRTLYLHKTGQPVPASYDKANPGKLLELYRATPNTTPEEAALLRDTFDFADPAHHQEPGYTTPITNNIVPHIDRLHTLAKDFRLLR